jgi:hypothetical protein
MILDRALLRRVDSVAVSDSVILESLARAQKEWVDFGHRRIKEDVAVSRQLMQCHSLADMHQVYSQYLTKAFGQYKEQSERVVQRGQSMAEHLAETAAQHGKEAARARHLVLTGLPEGSDSQRYARTLSCPCQAVHLPTPKPPLRSAMG